MLFGVGVSFRIIYSIVSYLYVSCSGSITSVGKVSYRLLVIMWFLCLGLGWAAILHCGTPSLFNIIIVSWTCSAAEKKTLPSLSIGNCLSDKRKCPMSKDGLNTVITSNFALIMTKCLLKLAIKINWEPHLLQT